MRTFIAAVVLASVLGGAHAQAVRPKIPPDALLGKITAATVSQVEIDGKTYSLAPGTRILNQHNLSVTPNMVAAGSPARYVLDAGGRVRAIWLVDEDDGTGTAPVQRTPGTE
ncbi:MAG TPA: hypothetical protein VMG60_16825 [Burkholderiaceae bacterium]|nr:hypothetical protein [Burkholderiaceae bacterium]